MNINDIFPVILYILGSILLVVLIILSIKIMFVLKKVDNAIEDYNKKSKKLNGLFDIIDNTTDTISSLSDKIVNLIISSITGLLTKKKKKEENIDE